MVGAMGYHDGEPRPRYRCQTSSGRADSGCGGLGITEMHIAPAIVDDAIRRVETPEWLDKLRRRFGNATIGERERAEQSLVDAERRYQELQDALGDGTISAEEWPRVRARATETIGEAMANLARATAGNVAPPAELDTPTSCGPDGGADRRAAQGRPRRGDRPCRRDPAWPRWTRRPAGADHHRLHRLAGRPGLGPLVFDDDADDLVLGHRVDNELREPLRSALLVATTPERILGFGAPGIDPVGWCLLDVGHDSHPYRRSSGPVWDR